MSQIVEAGVAPNLVTSEREGLLAALESEAADDEETDS